MPAIQNLYFFAQITDAIQNSTHLTTKELRNGNWNTTEHVQRSDMPLNC